MTTGEFSSEFDVIYNNIMSNSAPGLDEYEKSIFLTNAQSEILKNYFNPKGNKYGEGFDGSQKRQIDFSTLINTSSPTEVTSSYTKFDERSKAYRMPTNVLFILNETAVVSDRIISIVPVAYSEYTRLISKPYKYPFKGIGWRLFQSSSTVDTVSEVIAEGTISQYKVRYVRRPSPIVLSNIQSDYGVTIEGVGSVTECELDPILHKEILQRAVELAKMAYLGDPNAIVEMGQRSE